MLCTSKANQHLEVRVQPSGSQPLGEVGGVAGGVTGAKTIVGEQVGGSPNILDDVLMRKLLDTGNGLIGIVKRLTGLLGEGTEVGNKASNGGGGHGGTRLGGGLALPRREREDIGTRTPDVDNLASVAVPGALASEVRSAHRQRVRRRSWGLGRRVRVVVTRGHHGQESLLVGRLHRIIDDLARGPSQAHAHQRLSDPTLVRRVLHRPRESVKHVLDRAGALLKAGKASSQSSIFNFLSHP